jgi:hypothetical protein
MDMGSMSTGTGIPPLEDFPKIYWAVVGAAIATATVVNVINIMICRQRYVNAGWKSDTLSEHLLRSLKVIGCETRTTDTSEAEEHTSRDQRNRDSDHTRSSKCNTRSDPSMENDYPHASSRQSLHRRCERHHIDCTLLRWVSQHSCPRRTREYCISNWVCLLSPDTSTLPIVRQE